MELLGGLGSFGHEAGAGGDPLLEVLILDQLLDGAVLENAEARLPQVVDRELMGRVGEEDVRRFHRAHQRRGENSVHLRILEPLLQVGQLGASLVAQGDVRAAADVQPLQVAGRDAVADEMQLKCFHRQKHLDFRKVRRIVLKFLCAAGSLPFLRSTKYTPVSS